MNEMHLFESENDPKAFSQNLVQLIALRDDDNNLHQLLSSPHPSQTSRSTDPHRLNTIRPQPHHQNASRHKNTPKRKNAFEHPSQAKNSRLDQHGSWLYMKIRDRKPTLLLGLNHLSSCFPTLVVLSFVHLIRVNRVIESGKGRIWGAISSPLLELNLERAVVSSPRVEDTRLCLGSFFLSFFLTDLPPNHTHPSPRHNHKPPPYSLQPPPPNSLRRENESCFYLHGSQEREKEWIWELMV